MGAFQNAMALADVAHLAYLNLDFIEKQLLQWRYDSFEWIEDNNVYTQSFIVTRDNHIVVCFRGTGSGLDRITDANLFKTKSADKKSPVHRGFKKALDAVWGKISEKPNLSDPNKKIFFTRHSLGAALAQLAAYRQAATNVSRITGVYVFGSPRIRNGKYKTFLYINSSDLVTQVPPRILGYHHMGHTSLKFDLTHNLTSTFMSQLVGERSVDNINELDESEQEEIRKKLRSANNSIVAATTFLKVRSQEMPENVYGSTFDEGKLDEHGADQYLFKLVVQL